MLEKCEHPLIYSLSVKLTLLDNRPRQLISVIVTFEVNLHYKNTNGDVLRPRLFKILSTVILRFHSTSLNYCNNQKRYRLFISNPVFHPVCSWCKFCCSVLNLQLSCTRKTSEFKFRSYWRQWQLSTPRCWFRTTITLHRFLTFCFQASPYCCSVPERTSQECAYNIAQVFFEGL